MTTKTTHTPGRLYAVPGSGPISTHLLAGTPGDGDGDDEGTIIADLCEPNDDANAARLALCWNAHDSLVAACEAANLLISTMQGMPPSVDYIEEVRDILDAALTHAREAN